MKDLKKNIKLVWEYTKNLKIKIFLFILCCILHVILSVIIPIFSAKVILNLTSNILYQVILIGLIIFLLEICRNVIYFFSDYLSQYVYRELFTKIQIDLGRNILLLTNKCLDENSSGVFIERLTNDTTKIADVFNLINYELSSIITNVGIFIALLIIDYRIFLFVLVMVIIIGIFVNKRIKYKNTEDEKTRKWNENISGFTSELVRGSKDIKALNANNSFLSEFKNRLVSLNNARYRIGKVSRKYMLIIESLDDFFHFSVLCVLVYLITKNELSIATSLIVYNYTTNITYIVDNYSYLLEGLKNFNLSANRIFEIMYSDNFSKERFGNKDIDNIKGDFEFQNVSFSYRDDFPVLKNISFKVSSCESVAFVGKSGSGKTTIFNLLCKLYDVDSGTILIDNNNINDLSCSSIRNNITIITQNPYIFNMSIKDNLKLVKENITDEEIEEVCKLACLDEFINDLPHKYDTVVGEGGINLSGGQRQRLAIARALLAKTKIILFDEATSSLDNVIQEKIQKAIDNLQGNYTILIIAHRLSTIRECNRIMLIDKGRIIASGTHEELLNNCEEYRQLYEKELVE